MKTKAMLTKLLNGFKLNSMTLEEKYLANSTDLVDLEQRQKNIQRGTAPYQQCMHSIHNIRKVL